MSVPFVVVLYALLSMLPGVHAGLTLNASNNLALYWGNFTIHPLHCHAESNGLQAKTRMVNPPEN